MKEIKLNNNIVKYHKKIIKPINVILEIFKGKLYCTLLQNFINVCMKILPVNIFTNKKSVYRTLTNLYATWFFSLYSEYNYEDEYFFPSNNLNNTILYDILKDYCSIDDSIKNKEEIIKFIIDNNNLEYEKILTKNNDYKTNIFINQNRDNFVIKKYFTSEKRNNIDINFYKFNIIYNFNLKIFNIRLINILNNLIIPVKKYNKLKKIYSGFPDEFDKYIFLILFRYQLLGSNNNQLAVLPTILNKMKKDFELNIECFASTINTETDIYCSIYYDIEKYFGSIGSFFNIEIKKGTYSFNPPYQKDIIEKGIYKLFNFLKNKDEITFIITIPIWDNIGKEIMRGKNEENNNDTIEYDDFLIINKIKNSEYFRGLRMISKNDFTYLDHNFHLYKNTTIQNTYIIILSNFENNYIDVINNYNFFE
jgi:hypothetical protein